MRQASLFVVLILAAALAQAQDAPKRKSGLWEISSSSERSEGRSRDTQLQMCIEQSSDKPLQRLNGVGRKEDCKINKLQREGDKTTVDAVCTLNKTTATTHSVITGKFDSAYKIETTSKYNPPLRGMSEGKATQEAHWLGPCGADQKPGDVILASGKKFNLSDTGAQAKPDPAKGGTGGTGGTTQKAMPSPGRKPGQPAAPSYAPSQTPSQPK